MLIFSRAIISTDWSPAVRWWRWRWWLSGDGLGFHISDLWVSDYKMRGTAELSSAMPCINRLGWTNQPTWCLLTQYLNNALWSSYVTQTTQRIQRQSLLPGGGGDLLSSSETRMTGVRVTVHFCLAIIMVQPSSRHTISSHYTAWPQHTAHWTVIPNKQAEYAAPVCHAPLRWHPPDVARAGPGLRIATLRHYQWLHDH